MAQPVVIAEPPQTESTLDLLGWGCLGAAAALVALRVRSHVVSPAQPQPQLPLPVAMLALQGATGVRAASTPVSRTTTAQMINLFGNNEESKRRRDALSLRDARAGDRKVTFRKPNAATTGLLLGLKFRENFGKGVFIDKVVPNTEAAKLKQQGKLKEGDEVVMVSATFGDEMWSARGIGKYRLEKSIAVRQGATISLVLENPKDLDKRAQNSREAQKARDRMTRMQRQLQEEVDTEKKKGWFNF